MTFYEYILLISSGIAAGFINTVAGGGSLLTLPLLIFMGLSAAEANGSNRVALFIQNIFAVRGFKSKGISVFSFSYWISISATLGALIGAYFATEISTPYFKKILSIIMVSIVTIILFKPYLIKKEVQERFTKKRNFISIFLFFCIGVYGGFIQAGVGFIIMAALTGIHNLNLVKTNSIKVFVVLCYTPVALLIYIYKGKVLWIFGLVLAIGNAIGGWIASRWSTGVNEKWIRLLLILTLSTLAIKLWLN